MNRSAPRPLLSGYAAVAAAAAAWGTIGLASRRIFAAGLGPLDAAAWRATSAFVILLIYCLLRERAALRIRAADILLFAAYGAVSVAGFMTVYFTAIALTTVAAAAVLLYTAPAWVVLLARPFFGEPVTRMKAAAVTLVFAGCALVVGLGPAAARLNPVGVLAGLGAGLTYGLYSIFGKVALRRHSPLTTAVYSLGFGALFLLVASRGLAPVQAAGAWALAYVIAVPTVAAYLLYIAGLRRVEAGRASVVATVEPVVAALTGSLMLHEPFGLTQWMGAALVLAGVMLV
ncbi:MAG: DMT family transporter, partial [Gemmatimonadales bacterium]